MAVRQTPCYGKAGDPHAVCLLGTREGHTAQPVGQESGKFAGGRQFIRLRELLFHLGLQNQLILAASVI